MNRFLKTREEVDACTEYIKANNLISHDFTCKNWDVALICVALSKITTPNDILDMGSNGSFLLPNAVKLGIQGRKCGIDLGNPEYDITGIEFLKGDLMYCPYEDNSFDTITCLSVVEHEVDYQLLAKECARLLKKGGKLYITFDYWNPKVDTTGIKLYDLSWTVLDRELTENLIAALKSEGLNLTSEMDWTTQDTVINPQFCAPYEKSYTFGILSLTKN